MAKTLPSAIGVDLGEFTLKLVLIQRKGASRYALAGFSVIELGDEPLTEAVLAEKLKAGLKEISGSSKYASVAVSSRGAVLRIIEQPPTPPEYLRKAIALNSMTLLNQDCKDYVLDCDQLDADTPPSEQEKEEGGEPAAPRAKKKLVRYLVGGIQRSRIGFLQQAFGKCRQSLMNVQLAPVSNMNAFAASNGDGFKAASFMLVDVGHEETSVLMGVEGDLRLVRTIDYGGKVFLDAVTAGGAIEAHAATMLLQQGDAGMAEASRMTIMQLAREIQSSIAFFEGQHEYTVREIFVSGAICRAELPLQMLSDELDLPCQLWDPFANVEVLLNQKRREELSYSYVQLGAAFGAALEILDRRA